MANKKEFIYDESGEALTRDQITEAYHSGVVDSWIEESAESKLNETNAENDPKE